MTTSLEVDVVVVGGGPAGIGAGIAAARAGAKTLVLEKHGFLGGVASWGMGMQINQMLPLGKSRGPVHDLVVEKLRSYGDEAVIVDKHRLRCNVEYLKVALMDALDEHGCSFLLHSGVVDTLVRGERVTGVVVGTKSGLVQVRAAVTVDASGDADVAHFAGAETLKRNEEGYLSPMTLCFLVSPVEVSRAREWFYHPGTSEEGWPAVLARAKTKYPLLPERLWLDRTLPLRDTMMVNHPGSMALGPLDGSDPKDLSRAEAHNRRAMLQIAAALREFGGPVFKDIQITAAGSQVGVRQSRRVKGRYVITEQDVRAGRRFEDTIAWRGGCLDITWVNYDPSMAIHDVPYRALLPEHLEGLLASGRCISADHYAHHAGKCMGNCMATGQAAGVAAALAARKGGMPGDLDVREVQAALVADGVPLYDWPAENID